MPASSAFIDNELSCDWNQFSSAIQTKELTAKQYKYPLKNKVFKNPEHYFIVSLLVSNILQIGNSSETIKHDPIQFLPRIKGDPNNRAHSLVISNLPEKLLVKQRKLLANCSEWEIFNESIYVNLIKSQR